MLQRRMLSFHQVKIGQIGKKEKVKVFGKRPRRFWCSAAEVAP